MFDSDDASKMKLLHLLKKFNEKKSLKILIKKT